MSRLITAIRFFKYRNSEIEELLT